MSGRTGPPAARAARTQARDRRDVSAPSGDRPRTKPGRPGPETDSSETRTSLERAAPCLGHARAAIFLPAMRMDNRGARMLQEPSCEYGSKNLQTTLPPTLMNAVRPGCQNTRRLLQTRHGSVQRLESQPADHPGQSNDAGEVERRPAVLCKAWQTLLARGFLTSVSTQPTA